jgi:hypothetical protein
MASNDMSQNAILDRKRSPRQEENEQVAIIAAEVRRVGR